MKDEELFGELLAAWEETYKKGQLTLWIFLSLKESEKYVDEIKHFIETNSEGAMVCEEQSIYRNLRKFQHLGIVNYSAGKGNKGPERKYYYLTDLGNDLFSAFIKRNIQLFFKENIQQLIR